MKRYQKIILFAALVWAPGLAHAEAAETPAAAQAEAELAPAKSNSHLKLCTQLGLKVGRTYEFMISGNEELHYWTIRSLGARGWVMVRDSRHPGTWLNLSRVIAVTPVDSRAAAERAVKPNRLR